MMAACPKYDAKDRGCNIDGECSHAEQHTERADCAGQYGACPACTPLPAKRLSARERERVIAAKDAEIDALRKDMKRLDDLVYALRGQLDAANDERERLIIRAEAAEARVRELEAALKAAQGLIFAHHDTARMQKFEAGNLCPVCVPRGVEDSRVDQIAKAAHGITTSPVSCPECESKAREAGGRQVTYEEACAWLRGERSMINIIPQDPFKTWVVRIAQADAAMTEQAYWIVKAKREGGA